MQNVVETRVKIPNDDMGFLSSVAKNIALGLKGRQSHVNTDGVHPVRLAFMFSVTMHYTSCVEKSQILAIKRAKSDCSFKS